MIIRKRKKQSNLNGIYTPLDFMPVFCFTVKQMKKNIFIPLLFCIGIFCFSQNITTAAAFFSAVSDKYAQFSDYVVDMNITSGASKQPCTAMFKRPDMLRLDFKSPAEQCIVFSGNTLSIYLPDYRTILRQEIDKSSAGGTALATPQGLSLMKRSYTIQYETSASPVQVEEVPSESVVILIMNRKSASETFKTLRVMISPESKLIRRIEAVPVSGGKVIFDFYNYRINVGVKSQNFVFDAPPTAKVLDDFLFIE